MTTPLTPQEMRKFTQSAGLLAQKIIHLCRESGLGMSDCAFTLGIVIKSIAKIKAAETDDDDIEKHVKKLKFAFDNALNNPKVQVEVTPVDNVDELSKAQD